MDDLLKLADKLGLWNITSAFFTAVLVFWVGMKNERKYLVNDISTIKNDYKELKGILKEYEFSLTVLRPIIENYSMFQDFINIYKGEEKTIYVVLQAEYEKVKLSFIKNYLNGSEKEKALHYISTCEENTMNCLSEFKYEAIFREFIIDLIEIINKEIMLDLIGQLEKMDVKTIKASLIAKSFENLSKLILWMGLKYERLITLNKEEMRFEIINKYTGMDISTGHKDLEKEIKNEISGI